MASHTGSTPLAENLENNDGEIFFNQPKSLKRVLDHYVRQRNTFLAATVLLFVACIVLLVCFIVLKRSEDNFSPSGRVCNTLRCTTNAAGRLCTRNLQNDFYANVVYEKHCRSPNATTPNHHCRNCLRAVGIWFASSNFNLYTLAHYMCGCDVRIPIGLELYSDKYTPTRCDRSILLRLQYNR